MKTRYLILLLSQTLVPFLADAQDRIYRCGNEYTNTVSEAQAKHCKLVSGGNVTVVQAVKPAPASTKVASNSRVDVNEQRAKDSDARLILESELKRAEARHEELLKEHNNGEPERLPLEVRNQQKYMERIADLKAAISRNENDIAGIRRELSRVPAAGSASAAK